MYPCDHAPFCRVRKVYITASAAALAATEPIISPTKSFEILTEMNINDVDALTTDLSTELARKRIRAEANSDAQADRVPV